MLADAEGNLGEIVTDRRAQDLLDSIFRVATELVRGERASLLLRDEETSEFVIARATGHDTYKLPFGHRGANHPVHERLSGRVLVTSQNHGFAVAASDAAEVSHLSLYDGTVEGLDLPELRARSLQFHPEAGPGPHDAWPLLEAWVNEVANA